MLHSTRLVQDFDCLVLRRKSAVKRRLSVRNPLQQSATNISEPFPRGRTLAGAHPLHAGRTTVPFFHMAYPVILKDAPKGCKAL
jgi:hypothetical protein